MLITYLTHKFIRAILAKLDSGLSEPIFTMRNYWSISYVKTLSTGVQILSIFNSVLQKLHYRIKIINFNKKD